MKDVGRKSKSAAGSSKHKDMIDNPGNFSAIIFSITVKDMSFVFETDKNGSESSNSLTLIDEQIDD